MKDEKSKNESEVKNELEQPLEIIGYEEGVCLGVDDLIELSTPEQIEKFKKMGIL